MDVSTLFHLLVIALFLAVFGEASLAKIVDRSTPDWFVDKYRGTWMGRLPAPLLWWTIALLELGTAGLFLAALVTGEPFAGETELTALGLAAATLVFVVLCFGLRVALDYAGAANAFFYAALTVLLYAAIDLGALT